VGVGFGGFFFCVILAGELSPPTRPIFPEPELGYTHLIPVMHRASSVYVTSFEYLARTYGFFATLGFSMLSGICGYALGFGENSRTYPGQILVVGAAAPFFAFMYLIWLEGFLQ
jgi:hypothetical protein